MAMPIIPGRPEFHKRPPIPRSMKEAFELGYEYAGGDGFADPEAFLPGNNNVMEAELAMEWEVNTATSEEASELPGLVTRVKVRLEFLDIFPAKD